MKMFLPGARAARPQKCNLKHKRASRPRSRKQKFELIGIA